MPVLAVLFLRESLKEKSYASSYEEHRVVDAFRATVAAKMTRHSVESTEADVRGLDGGSARGPPTSNGRARQGQIER